MSDSFATPWTVTNLTPLSMGFPRQEYWIGLPCPPPGDLPNPGIEPMSLASQEDSSLLSHWGRPCFIIYNGKNGKNFFKMWCVRCQLNSKETLGKFISEPTNINRLQILQSALSLKQKKKKRKISCTCPQIYVLPIEFVVVIT